MSELDGSVKSPASWKGRAGQVDTTALPKPVASEAASSHSGGISLGSLQHRWLLFLGDAFLIIVANFLSSWIRFGLVSNTLYVYGLAVVVTLVVYPSALYVFDLYNLERTFRSWETAFRSSLTVVAGGLVSMVVFYLLPGGAYGRGIMAIQMCLVWLFFNAWRLAYGALFQTSAIGKTPILVLGAGHCGKAIFDLLCSPFSPYEIKGFLDDDLSKQGMVPSASILGTIKQLRSVAARVGVSTVILAIPKERSPELIRNILDARFDGINVLDMADVYEKLTGRIPIRYIADQWLLSAEGFSLLYKEYVQKIKRLVDVGFSGLLLALTAPLFGIAALAVRLDSSGPIFYRQERVGKGRKTFTIYKFRSMREDAESGGARWAAEKDPRVTKVGHLLRLSHVDELPQIWNVFRGDMSVVGPRPERPEFVKMLEETVPYYAVRHSVRPGITGWAQVSYRYGASIEDAMRKLESDLYYVKNMSLFLDLKIMLRTVGVVFLTDGAR
jgi:sugar transferase (PEP-CTERM system associated)